MSSDINTAELRQRTPSFSRHHCLPSARRKSGKKPPKQLRRSPKPIQVMIKSYSEPLIIQPLGDGDNLIGGCRSFDSAEGASIVRFNTLDDVLPCTSDFSRINMVRIFCIYISSVFLFSLDISFTLLQSYWISLLLL